MASIVLLTQYVLDGESIRIHLITALTILEEKIMEERESVDEAKEALQLSGR